MESSIFSYGMAHNHNFSFMTAGHLGPGYRSRIFEADPSKIRGHLGEKIELRFLEDTTLPTGKIMIYRRGLDVHTQLPPLGLSISLNLLLASSNGTSMTQYYVDTDTGEIIGFPEVNTASKRLTLLSMAAILGDTNTVDLLDGVARRSPCFRTRVGAATAVLQLLASAESASYLHSLPFDPNVLDVSVGQGRAGGAMRQLT